MHNDDDEDEDESDEDEDASPFFRLIYFLVFSCVEIHACVCV